MEKYNTIIYGIAQEYRSKHEVDLRKGESEVTQDCINRGLCNTTVRISNLVVIQYEYVKGLSDYLIEKLEKDYPHILPSKCLDKILEIIKEEYEIIKHKIPAWLHESNLLDEGMQKSYINNVDDKINKEKNAIKNKCALWQERWKQKRKFWKSGTFGAAIGVFISIIALILGFIKFLKTMSD